MQGRVKPASNYGSGVFANHTDSECGVIPHSDRDACDIAKVPTVFSGVAACCELSGCRISLLLMLTMESVLTRI